MPTIKIVIGCSNRLQVVYKLSFIYNIFMSVVFTRICTKCDIHLIVAYRNLKTINIFVVVIPTDIVFIGTDNHDQTTQGERLDINGI